MYDHNERWCRNSSERFAVTTLLCHCHPYDPEESNTNREEALSILKDAIYDVHDRIKEREVETPEDEQMLIKGYRTLGSLSGQYRLLQRDTDIDEMEEDLELLQEATNLGDSGDDDE